MGQSRGEKANDGVIFEQEGWCRNVLKFIGNLVLLILVGYLFAQSLMFLIQSIDQLRMIDLGHYSMSIENYHTDEKPTTPPEFELSMLLSRLSVESISTLVLLKIVNNTIDSVWNFVKFCMRKFYECFLKFKNKN